MNYIHSALDTIRDRYAPISHTSTFRSTGQITPDEFVLAGDFLVFKFPSWSWTDASHPSKRAAYLPDGKQFLITRGVPCHARLDDNFAGDAGLGGTVESDGFDPQAGAADDGDDGWLRTGNTAVAVKPDADPKDVRTLDGSGNLGERADCDDDEIPDMEDDDDDDEAIIRDPRAGSNTKAPLRTYTVYITYTPYYRTPRLYLSGYASASEPLPPKAMMEDIVGSHADKTVTLEDFPFFDASQSVKMASVHPCKHASVMKVLLDRADAALRLRRERAARTRAGDAVPQKVEAGLEGLVDRTDDLTLAERKGHRAGVAAAGGTGNGDEWEVLEGEGNGDEDDGAIRIDQYLVVFLKFFGTIMPALEHDFTMSL